MRSSTRLLVGAVTLGLISTFLGRAQAVTFNYCTQTCFVNELKTTTCDISNDCLCQNDTFFDHFGECAGGCKGQVLGDVIIVMYEFCGVPIEPSVKSEFDITSTTVNGGPRKFLSSVTANVSPTSSPSSKPTTTTTSTSKSGSSSLSSETYTGPTTIPIPTEPLFFAPVEPTDKPSGVKPSDQPRSSDSADKPIPDKPLNAPEPAKPLKLSDVDKKGLSTAAKAGMAVGIVAGGLLLIGALVGAFLLFRRKKDKKAKLNGADNVNAFLNGGSGAPGPGPQTTQYAPVSEAGAAAGGPKGDEASSFPSTNGNSSSFVGGGAGGAYPTPPPAGGSTYAPTGPGSAASPAPAGLPFYPPPPVVGGYHPGPGSARPTELASTSVPSRTTSPYVPYGANDGVSPPSVNGSNSGAFGAGAGNNGYGGGPGGAPGGGGGGPTGYNPGRYELAGQ